MFVQLHSISQMKPGKVIARRAALELSRDEVVNLGFDESGTFASLSGYLFPDFFAPLTAIWPAREDRGLLKWRSRRLSLNDGGRKHLQKGNLIVV